MDGWQRKEGGGRREEGGAVINAEWNGMDTEREGKIPRVRGS